MFGLGHPFAKGNSRSRGTGKVEIPTRQVAGRSVLPVSFLFRVAENNDTCQFERDNKKVREYIRIRYNIVFFCRERMALYTFLNSVI